MEKIVLSNQKGGVGKSTSSIEIATCMGKIGKRVLLIDFDQQCNLSVYCNSVNNSKNIFDALSGNCTVQEAIQKKEYFDLICGSEALSRSDRIFIDNDDKYLLDDLLSFLKDDYDYVIIDTAPTRNIVLTMAYVCSDYIILPTECDEGSRNGIIAIESDIMKLKSSRDKACHAEILGYILTKYEKTTMHEIALDNLQNLSDEKDNKPFIMKVSKAINMSKIKTLHTSIIEYAPSSTPARDYFAITDEIIKRIEGI